MPDIGIVTKNVRRTVTGTATGAGSLAKATLRAALTATLSTAGALAKQTQRAVAGSLLGAGTLARQTWKALSGALSAAGSLLASRPGILYTQALSATLSAAGALSRQTNRALSAALNTAGSLARLFIEGVTLWRPLYLSARAIAFQVLERVGVIALGTRSAALAAGQRATGMALTQRAISLQVGEWPMNRSLGLFQQGIDEQIAYSITTTKWGSSPTSPSVVVKDVTAALADVTATVMPTGTASAAGDVITLPKLKSLTVDHIYRIEVQFTIGGNLFECWFEVEAEL